MFRLNTVKITDNDEIFEVEVKPGNSVLVKIGDQRVIIKEDSGTGTLTAQPYKDEQESKKKSC